MRIKTHLIQYILRLDTRLSPARGYLTPFSPKHKSRYGRHVLAGQNLRAHLSAEFTCLGKRRI